MKTILLSALLISLLSCSAGKAEKPVPLNISSPEKLLNQGTQQYTNNNYHKATHYFEKALLQYRSIDNQTGIAKSCLNLAKSHMAISNNTTAEKYLNKAEEIITTASLTQLSEHLQLAKSTLALKNKSFVLALRELKHVLNSKHIPIRLAALKNRTKISFLLARDNIHSKNPDGNTHRTNTDDRQQWLDQYRTLQKNNPENTNSHLARIYRFEAELATSDNEKHILVDKALVISRKQANRPAIAATLVQSADIDQHSNNMPAAEDKLIRALFIRHQLGDINNTLLILKQLDNIYLATASIKQKITDKWIRTLTDKNINKWDDLLSDFETYPVTH